MSTKKTARKSSKRVSTKKYKSKSPLSLANSKYLVIILMVCALIPLTMIMQVFFGNIKSIAHTQLPEVFVGENDKVNRVFITSTSYYGDLGGLVGADAKCQNSADSANLGGEWKAWLSDNNTTASSRHIHSTDSYVRLDGLVVANNWEDLTDGTLQNAINIDEFGRNMNSWGIWTNTQIDGTLMNYGSASCNNWESAIDGTYGHLGCNINISTPVTDSYWTWNSSDYCSSTYPLYCIEQNNNQPIPMVEPSTKPTPKPTAKPNSKPKITTNSLPWAYIGRTYNAIIEGTDTDSNDTLNMTITGLPDFLSAGSCKQIKDSKKQNVVYNCSIVSNGAIRLTYTKTYQVNVTLTDNRGGKDTKTLPLRVYTSIKPVATKYPVPTIRP